MAAAGPQGALTGRPAPASPVPPRRANLQPAFGCYLRDAHAPLTRAYTMLVLTLAGNRVSALTVFTDAQVCARFGLPRTVPA